MDDVEAPPHAFGLPRARSAAQQGDGNGKKIRSEDKAGGQKRRANSGSRCCTIGAAGRHTTPEVGLCVKACFAEVGVFIQKVQEKPLKVPNNSKKGKRTSENGPIRSIF